MRKIVLGLSVLSLIIIAYTACRHEIPYPMDPGTIGGPPVAPPSTPSCSADTVYFVNTVLPILTSNCAMVGCHDATTHKEGLVLSNFTGIMRIVQVGNANGSKLVQVITTTNPGDRMPPPPYPALTADQIAAIKKWINQGARNNYCAACDTTQFTFSGAVKNILQNKCVGCHTGANAGGGVDLSTYANVLTVATSGKLMGSINQLTGFKPMPLGGLKLPDCEIRQIQKWIDAGAQNN